MNATTVKSVNEMTRKEIEAVPMRERWDLQVKCNSLVIIPLRQVHDSGYRVMDFLAVRNQEPLCRVSGCSDVLHIDGIGGYGEWEARNGVPRSVEPKGWSIDCLAKSGLLRLFARNELTVAAALSSLSIYCAPNPPLERGNG